MQDDFAKWIPSYPVKLKETSETHVVFTKDFSLSFTEAGMNLHRQLTRVFIQLVKIYNGIMTQAPLIAQKRAEWQKQPPAE